MVNSSAFDNTTTSFVFSWAKTKKWEYFCARPAKVMLLHRHLLVKKGDGGADSCCMILWELFFCYRNFSTICCGANGFRSTLVIPRLQGLSLAVACHIFGQQWKDHAARWTIGLGPAFQMTSFQICYLPASTVHQPCSAQAAKLQRAKSKMGTGLEITWNYYEGYGGGKLPVTKIDVK